MWFPRCTKVSELTSINIGKDRDAGLDPLHRRPLDKWHALHPSDLSHVLDREVQGNTTTRAADGQRPEGLTMGHNNFITLLSMSQR